ncbi:MAG: trigger factor [Chloroflexi bacterium]|nr:trigger factor [Chloroflexota bacterium]
MKVTSEELPDRQVALTVEVEEERAQRALQQTARRLSKRLRIPGFRPGKAPFPIVVRTVGEDHLRAEAFEAIGQQLYEEALKEAEVEAYAQGTLEEVQWDPLTFKVTVPLPPRVELGDYHALRVAADPILVLDEEVDEALQQLRERHVEWAPVDRAAAYEDMLVMDIVGRVGEEEIMNHQNWERVLREESGGSLPGFDDALLGLKAGDNHSFDLAYAEGSSRAGETVHFEVTLHGVKARELPPLDDEFAQTVGEENETLEALREAVRENLRAQREAESDYEGKVLDVLVEQGRIEFPPLILEGELDDLLEDHDRLLRQQGMPLDDWLRVSGKSKEAYREEQRPQAERRLKRSLALSKLVEQEELTVKDDDVDEEIERRVAAQPDAVAERVRGLFDSPNGRQMLRKDLLTRKALLRLLTIARGELEFGVRGSEFDAEHQTPNSELQTPNV